MNNAPVHRATRLVRPRLRRAQQLPACARSRSRAGALAAVRRCTRRPAVHRALPRDRAVALLVHAVVHAGAAVGGRHHLVARVAAGAAAAHREAGRLVVGADGATPGLCGAGSATRVRLAALGRRARRRARGIAATCRLVAAERAVERLRGEDARPGSLQPVDTNTSSPQSSTQRGAGGSQAKMHPGATSLAASVLASLAGLDSSPPLAQPPLAQPITSKNVSPRITQRRIARARRPARDYVTCGGGVLVRPVRRATADGAIARRTTDIRRSARGR